MRWTSNTSGDYDGLILDLDFNEKTEMIFKSEQKDFSIKVSEIGEELIVYPAGGENLKVEVNLANKICTNQEEFIRACNVDYAFKDMEKNPEGNAYWVRILQEDGHMAWSSPIFTK